MYTDWVTTTPMFSKTWNPQRWAQVLNFGHCIQKRLKESHCKLKDDSKDKGKIIKVNESRVQAMRHRKQRTNHTPKISAKIFLTF